MRFSSPGAFFGRLNIAQKLSVIVIATGLGSVVLAGAGFFIYDAWDARSELRREVESLGQIVADRSTAALSFGDAKSASETLQALGAHPSILEAILIDAKGSVLAHFSRIPGLAPDRDSVFDSMGEGTVFKGRVLYLVRPVMLGAERLGTLKISSDLQGLRARQIRLLGISIGVAGLSFLTVFLLSGWARRQVSDPISSLAESARRVAHESDYSVRVEKRSNDELGDLVTAFNEMLRELERHDVALRQQRDRAEEHAARARRLFEETSEAKQALEGQIAERERLEAQVLHSQKMEAVGRLAGGVAHDFNNMLMVIRGYTDTILRDPSCPPNLKDNLAEIDAAAERAQSVTRQLLVFSRQQVLRIESIDLNETVRDTLSMLERVIGEDVELRAELSDSTILVRGDEGQLQQVLVNLAVNSRDAMPTGGVFEIATRHHEVKSGTESTTLEVEPGEYAIVRIRDNGEGISEESQLHVFDPFYTTKPAGEGTGLGLASVYGFVRQSGGAIRLESELGEGTTFEIYLPIETAPAAHAELTVARTAASGSETILLAEDEEPVRNLVRGMLTSHGYEVLVAENGEAALEVSRAYEGKIDLLVSDVVMPHMNARELVAQLEQERPGVPVLFVSGYLDDVVSRYGIETQGRDLLGKPFTEEELLEKVRELLDLAESAAPES